MSIEEQKLTNLVRRSLVSGGFAKLTRSGVLIDQKLSSHAKEITQLLLYLNQISCRNWLNHKHLYSWLCNIWQDKNYTLTLTSILCPTYKKDGSPGLNNVLGRTSKVGLQNIKHLHDYLQRNIGANFNIQIKVFFGNLSVERYADLNQGTWRKMLKNNLALLNEEAAKIELSTPIIPTDSISLLHNSIGYIGHIDPILSARNNRTESMYMRNRAFYVNKLGWSEQESDARTANSITTYSILGQYLTNALTNPIFFYTANSYEKSFAYNITTTRPLPIVYPRKSANGDIELIQSINGPGLRSS